MTVAFTRYRRSMREVEMQQGIIDLVAARGGLVWVVRDSRGLGVESMPDLQLVLPWKRTVAYVELKSQKRDVTDGQRHALDLLAECDRCEAMIVRPDPRPGERAYDDMIRWLGGEAA